MTSIEILAQISKSVRDVPAISELFNWYEISKLPLPDSFIIEHANYLNWDILARHQTFSIALADQFDNILKKRMHLLVLNSNLHSDVFSKYVTFMDWEIAQSHQKFTPELLRHYANMGNMELLIVLQHQKIPEDVIETLLQPIVSKKNWAQLRRYLALVFTYQIVSNTFINKYLLIENSLCQTFTQTHNYSPAITQITLVDLPLVIKHQKLDEEFLSTFCIPHIKTREEICRSQKLSIEFINKHFDYLDIRKLLKYQRLDEQTLIKCCEYSIFQKKTFRVENILSNSFPNSVHLEESTTNTNSQVNAEEFSPETQTNADRRLYYASLLLEKQVYSLELAGQIINSISSLNNRFKLWNKIFLRTLAPIGDDAYLGFSTETVVEHILPNVNWITIANTKLTSGQLDGIINLALDFMPWSLYLKQNQLSEEHIITLDNAGKIDAITWWYLLTKKRSKPFENSFINKYNDRKKWWRYINGNAFYTSVSETLKNYSNLGSDSKNTNLTFLYDFIMTTKWQMLLQEESLPEWFLQIFAHKEFSKNISNYWWAVVRWQHLTQDFIENNLVNLELQMILTYQIVSEEFIRDKLEFFTIENWKAIKTYQQLSNTFKEEFSAQLA